MTYYLFEDPWPAVAVLGCIAFALLVTGMRRRQNGWLIAAAATALLGVGVYATARTVTTDREVVERRTRDLVAATSPLDVNALRQSIDDSATVTLPNGGVLPMSLALSDELASTIGRHAVTQQTITGLYAQTTGPDTATVRLNVRSTLGEQAFRPIGTEWLLTWRRPPSGGEQAWRIVAVQWVKFEGRDPTADLWRQ